MSKLLLVAQFSNFNSYATAIEAARRVYSGLKFVDILVHPSMPNELSGDVRKAIGNLGFTEALSIQIHETYSEIEDINLKLYHGVDVSGVSKEMAIDVTAHVARVSPNLPVNMLHWSRNTQDFNLDDPSFQYIDLLKRGSFMNLISIKKKYKLAIYLMVAFLVMSAMVSLGAMVSIIEIPRFTVEFLNVMIGVGGVILSFASLKQA